MRKYLLGLFAVVAAVSLSAFTSAKSSDKAVKSASLYWFEYDISSGTGTYLNYGDRSLFIVPFSCDQLEGEDCRRGYSFEDLVDGDPEKGVIDDDSHEDQIAKPE
ncbi:MAG TPA: hypothetical protein VHN59_04895 [Chitinophagaceae bacterium]|nr:hypothetical protein [Chitinophagaceae bacterium]